VPPQGGPVTEPGPRDGRALVAG